MDTLSDLSSATILAPSSEEYTPTSTINYVNAQLVSHGFAPSPGLSLDGLANGDSERLVRCLLGLLGQRVEDLRRTEELGSKLRTLTYEHERLQSMHQVAVDSRANAEREMNLFKTKLAAAQKSLVAETAAHKQTVMELQRSRTSLQYLRSTSQNELKRKDRELERVMERWNKVSDAQTKLLTTPSGLRCANFVAEITETSRGPGLMEQALEQAEEARDGLVKENDAFRTVLLSAANALQGAICAVKNVEEPSPLTHQALFAPPISMLLQPENAYAKLRELFVVLREAIPKSSPSTSVSTIANPPGSEEEIKKLNELVASLRAELQQSRQSSSALAAQSQTLLDRFTTHASKRLISGKDPTPGEGAEISLELMGVPEQDEVRKKLDVRAAELGKEREKFTEAAVKLGKERTELENERKRLLEEKRRWAVEQMLADLPSTSCPDTDVDLVSPLHPSMLKPKGGSPSPPRARARKAGTSPKKGHSPKRVQKTVTFGKPISRDSKKLKEKTHSITYGGALREPESDAKDSRPDRGSIPQETTIPEYSPSLKEVISASAEKSASMPFVLPTPFKFPPPSPATSLAVINLGSILSQPSTSPPSVSHPQTSAPSVSQPSAPPPQKSAAITSFDSVPLGSASSIAVPAARSHPRVFPSPRTPLNPNLRHTYSPIRPSPLSRILMLADSPPSPPSEPPIKDREQNKPPLKSLPQKLLAQEFGRPVDEQSPLRELTGGDLNGGVGVHTMVQDISSQKQFTEKEKGKGRAIPVPGPTATEKENVTMRNPSSKVSSGVGVLKTKPKALKTTGVGDRKQSVPKYSAAKGGANEKGDGASKTTTGILQKPSGARRVPLSSATSRK